VKEKILIFWEKLEENSGLPEMGNQSCHFPPWLPLNSEGKPISHPLQGCRAQLLLLTPTGF